MARSDQSPPLPRVRRAWLLGGVCAIALLTALTAPIYHPPLLKPLLSLGAPKSVLKKIPAYRNAALAAEAPQITVQELQRILEHSPESVVLVDVRSEEEVAIARIPGSVHIPVELIENGWAIEQVQDLLQNSSIENPQLILHCYTGPRSHRALAQLREAGINGSNLKGGIKAWRDQIDSSLPKKLY